MDNQVNEENKSFSWKQVAQSFVNAVPYALLTLNQHRNQIMGQTGQQGQPQTNPIEMLENGKQYLVKTKNWLGQFPVIKIGGGLLIVDGLVSIFTHLDEKKIHHIVRLARAGLGYYIIKKL